MGDKARQWLDRGTRLVWIIWPDRREIDVWTAGAQEPRTIARPAAIDGGDVIPGFHLPLSAIWPNG